LALCEQLPGSLFAGVSVDDLVGIAGERCSLLNFCNLFRQFETLVAILVDEKGERALACSVWQYQKLQVGSYKFEFLVQQ
jgi:hypothetical protein